MEYKVLSQLRDTYPGEPDTVSDNYTKEGGQTKLTGLYPDNFIKFVIIPISDINIPVIEAAPNVTFRFIVQFKDGENVDEWTSANFLQDLQNANLEHNPYFTKEKVTIAQIDYGYLKEYWRERKFSLPELYANVRILDTLESKNDLLIHINWMVSGDEDLRPVKTFGNWVVELTDTLGFEYSDELEDFENGIAGVNPRGDSTIVLPRSGTVRDNATPATPRNDGTIVVPRSGEDNERDSGSTTTPRGEDTVIGTRSGTNFAPFNRAGRYTGELRTSPDGRVYIWSANGWVLNE